MLPRNAVICLTTILLLVGTAACGRAADGEKTPPGRLNVVVILADDLGWADLSCYGSKYHKTPNLDRLAARGMRFTDAYAAASICSPTRAALLTGKYPARLNLTDWLPGRADRPDQKLLRPVINQQLPSSEITLAAALKAAGYATGHIGKWHLGGKGAGPQQRGFDVNIAGDAAGSPRSYFAPFKSKDGRFIPGLERAPEGEYLTDRLTVEAEKFIESNRAKPFFLYLAHYTVHIPLRAKADMVAKYKPGRPGQQGNPTYAAMIESLDDGVGRILKKLDELKLSERTLVVFTSDNGGLSVLEGPNTPATINAPLREGKGYLYEGGLRVPLIVRCPGVTRPGSTSAAPVCSFDLFPTILDACGVKSDSKTDGVSLVSLMKGDALKREALFWHYPHYSNQGGHPGGAIRAGDYKLIEFYENGRRELYDVKKDLGESRNLSADKPEMVKELGEKLAAWRKAVGAKTMKPNSDYVPNPQAAGGTITLPARTAEVHGTQLRYEPLPHKNTLGFWVRTEDWASWEFTITRPGSFTVEVLQGCGKGQGGSVVEVSIGERSLTFTVEDTGHFQNFKSRTIGTVTLDKAGRYTLTVRPKKKAAAAVMDLRAVTLKPATK
ncbi:MAG TPA: sulfatase-like hydrolase/transferase [Gemmataceae bacterium]|nr:sulfatase-like hydrolase/transferase [Gemmataceae bacterium]